MSTIVVNPATTEAASASSTSLHCLPMITPSSPSAVVRCDCGGIRIASPGPMIAVSGLRKLAGSVEGAFSDRSAACST